MTNPSPTKGGRKTRKTRKEGAKDSLGCLDGASDPNSDRTGRSAGWVRARIWKLAQGSLHDDQLFIWCLSAGLVTLSWILQSRIGVNLSDEGFLWYGSWRVGHGEVPILDFRSYDPGRYYWVAFWSLFFGDGLLGHRAGVSIFQVTGLSLGLFAVRSVVHKRIHLFLVGVMLVVWMLPRHKLFECALSMGAVYVATRLVQNPNPRRIWLAGVYVGVAAFFGRNHGLYTFAAFGTILGLLCWQTRTTVLPRAGRFIGGIVVGYSPMFILVLLHPGFLSSFFSSVLAIVKRGTTNVPLPIPWPWTVDLAGQYWLQAAHQLLLGVAFMALLGFFPIAVGVIARRPSHVIANRPLLCAATFVGIAYAHHALVRADVFHLAQAIHPMLLGVVAMMATASRRRTKALTIVAAAVLAILTVFVPMYQQPLAGKLLYDERYETHVVTGERIWMWKSDADYLDALRGWLDSDVEPGDRVFLDPHGPALYVILGLRSPVWDIYPLWPGTAEHQQRMIQELRRNEVRWAVIGQDSREGFKTNNPAVWEFLLEHFEVVHAPGPSHAFVVFRRLG